MINYFIENDILEIEEEGYYDYFLESTEPTFTLRDKIYPNIQEVLDTSQGDKIFRRYVSEFIDRNSQKLHTAGPQHLVMFYDKDKENFYKLFNIDTKYLLELINIVVKSLNDKANWKLLKGNPIFIIFFFVIRYYTIRNDTTGINNALVILALAMYPSIFDKYYTYEPNPAVMQYTIDNLSNKFGIKKSKHILGNLMNSIQQSWTFHKQNIMNGSDKNAVDFIMRIRNDQNSLMKKIAKEYFDNHKKNLTVYTSTDSFDDNAVVDVENDSNKVESVTEKIVMSILINGVDLRLALASATATKTNRNDMRNYLNTIICEKNIEDMKMIVEGIVSIYLYENKKSLRDINTSDFLEFSLRLFKKNSSKNENIYKIKSILEKWIVDLEIDKKYRVREATVIDYKRAFYMYFVFSIQKYND